MPYFQIPVKRAVLGSSILGNALEFYDFTLCGAFIPILSQVFFPKSDAFNAILLSFFAFSAAFWTRPLGAILFGYIGDRFGRKTALMLSLSLMGIPTGIIGFLPGYEVIGIVASVLLIAFRMLQGLCTGGEYNGAAIFALEHFKERPGLVSGLISSSCVIGALMATVFAAIATLPQVPSWSWRVPFILGSCISLVGAVIRYKTTETPDFLAYQKKIIQKQNLFILLKKDKTRIWLAVMLGFFNGILSYTLFGFLSTYLSRYINISISTSQFYGIFGMLSFLLACIFFGHKSDQIGPRSSLLRAGLLAIFLPWICFFLFQLKTPLSIISGEIMLGIVVGSFVGPTHCFLQTLFPVSHRYTAVSVSFCIGMAAGGSTTGMLALFLTDKSQNLFMPAVCVAIGAIVWLIHLALIGKNSPQENQTPVNLGLRKVQ